MIIHNSTANYYEMYFQIPLFLQNVKEHLLYIHKTEGLPLHREVDQSKASFLLDCEKIILVAGVTY